MTGGSFNDGAKKGKMGETDWKTTMTVALVTAFLLPAVTVSMAIFSMADVNPAPGFSALLTN